MRDVDRNILSTKKKRVENLIKTGKKLTKNGEDRTDSVCVDPMMMMTTTPMPFAQLNYEFEHLCVLGPAKRRRAKKKNTVISVALTN